MFPALQRFFEAVECRTQAELAEFLGIKQSSISDAKKKNDSSRLASHCAAEKRNQTDWILTGQGARMLQSCDGMGMVVPLHVPVLEIRPPEECTMEELMVEIFRRASKTINKNKLH